MLWLKKNDMREVQESYVQDLTYTLRPERFKQLYLPDIQAESGDLGDGREIGSEEIEEAEKWLRSMGDTRTVTGVPLQTDWI